MTKMNFYSDAVGICEQRLLSAGYTDQGTPERNLQAYLNVLNRRVPVQKRCVYKARTYSVPPTLASGEQQFLNAVIYGADLRPYQSTKIADPDFEDAMLNDFGIQHFHVGVGPHPTRAGFKDRTDPVLFAMVKGDSFYCIGFFHHGEWARQDLLDITHDNWPNVLAASAVNGVIGLSRQLSDQDIARLRKANINVATQRPDGTVHFAPGGGQTTAGTSFNSTWAKIRLRQMCDDLERQVGAQFNGANTRPPPENVALEERSGSFVVRSTDASFEVPVNDFHIPML